MRGTPLELELGKDDGVAGAGGDWDATDSGLGLGKDDGVAGTGGDWDATDLGLGLGEDDGVAGTGLERHGSGCLGKASTAGDFSRQRAQQCLELKTTRC